MKQLNTSRIFGIFQPIVTVRTSDDGRGGRDRRGGKAALY